MGLLKNLGYFDKVVVLNVDKRICEQERLNKDVKSLGGSPVYFIVGDGKVNNQTYDRINIEPSQEWMNGPFKRLRNSYNAFLSYQDIIKDAKEKNLNNICLLEDDVEFRCNAEVLMSINLNILHDKWDLLYLGANHTWAKTKKVAPNLLQIDGSVCWHAIALNKTVFDEILSWKPDRPIDDKAKELHKKYRCYAIWPSIAVQRPGFSNVEGRFVDYSKYWDCIGEQI